MRIGRFFPLIVMVALALMPLSTFPQAQGNPRIRQNINVAWLFARQSQSTGLLGSFERENGAAARIEPRFRSAHTPEYDDSSWQSIDLPHTWNAFDVMGPEPGYWRGIGWYRKHFEVASSHQGKRVFLEFEGVNSVSEFWVNGQRIGDHKGGYTSFEFDITDQVRFGARNVLTVKVDNLFHAEIPPTVKSDYTFYGGIYRDVWLRISDSTYVSEVTWTTPTVNAEQAGVNLKSTVINRSSEVKDFILIQEILDPQQKLVKTASTSGRVRAGGEVVISQEMGPLANPLLWAPDTPNVYRIRTSMKEGNRLLDSVESPLGFRWFRFDSQRGFFLNGKRVQIQGTNWHQFYPGMGSALPNSRHVRDMEMIREMGCNFWRTSHYPHDPATIEASDRLGLMVWEELPINKEIGKTDEYIANVLEMAREMIRRDRNHPSIILWGIAGEINAPLSVSNRVVAATAKQYRELDPSRPVAMHAPRGDEIEALVDVVGLDVGKETDEKHLNHPDRPIMIGEFSASTMGRGIYGMGPESEDLACQRHEEHLRELIKRPWMAGGAIWEQFDYEGETYDSVIPNLVAFGMADTWRIPKETYYFYQSEWASKPMLHILGHWTWPGDEGKERTVKVYSNSGEVELFLNGKSLGVKRGGDNEMLPHPPRMWQVPYQPGELKAVARIQGKELVDVRRTAGPAHHIALESDVQQLESGNPESLAYITAKVVDENNTVVPNSFHRMTFSLYGPGQLLEQNWPGYGTGLTWNAVAGITGIAFRATPRSGLATIRAYAPGLGMGRIELTVSRPGKPNEMEYIEKFGTEKP